MRPKNTAGTLSLSTAIVVVILLLLIAMPLVIAL